MTESVYWVWLQQLFGYGSRRAGLMMDYFAHPRELYDGIAAQNHVVGMLTAAELAASQSCMQNARELEARTRNKGCDILTPEHPAYPALLQRLYDRPAALYIKGDISCLQGALTVAMVGTRAHTDYGREAAGLLAGGLAREGAVVVSGLAHGIDTECHRAALAAGGKTVGVLGCGLDIDYPKGSGPLKTAMRQNGAVISEYPLGVQPLPANFPLRNRIISGMSNATVVVEADLRSGSLITARLAREQGREVFAVPGSIFQQGAQGANALLKEGASPVDCAEDVFAAYPWYQRQQSAAAGVQVAPVGAPPGAPRPAQSVSRQCPVDAVPVTAARAAALPETVTEPAHKVYAAFGADTVTVDDIAASTALSAADILTALTELEIYGCIQSFPGRRFGLLS